MKLRSHLVMLVVAAIVPLAVFAAFIVVQNLKERREILDRGLLDTVRALTSAADGEVKASLAVLETLAAAPALARGDLKEFHELCVQATAHRKGAWIVLFDATGQQVVNSSRPFGSPLPNPLRQAKPPAADERYPLLPLGGAAPVRKVLETGRPVVSDLFIALDSRQPTIAVATPVLRDAGVRYVLEMSVDHEALLQILLSRRPPADEVASFLDGRGLAIARTLNPAVRLGQPLAAELAAQAAGAHEGTGAGRIHEGTAVYHAFTRSAVTGWTTTLAIPQDAAGASLTDALAFLTGGAAIAVLLGLLAALIIGKRISTPIWVLARSANALARGERAQLDVSGVRELEELHRALVTAGEGVRRGATEHARRLSAEAKEAEARAASRTKDEFLATLSHELRNPLAALSAAAHVLKVADPSRDAAVTARNVVERQTKHMARLIGDLLDVSRITLGKLALERERLDLGDVVSRLLNVWRSSGRFERHDVSLEAAPVWIDADRARIEQITANLLDNALKFTPAGKTVKIRVSEESGAAVLRIADEGEGLARDAAANIFELFVQAGTKDRQGLGIGLALVKRLTEMHGGSVSVASEGPGRGAEFVVRLPAVPPPARDAAAPTATASARSILIVEDNDDARQMLEALLALSGHEVRAARDGATGLALAADAPPDVVLIDVGLPDMDGYELARRLRAARPGRRISLVALTGYGQPEDQRRALESGFDVHLTKPVAADRLKQVLTELA